PRRSTLFPYTTLFRSESLTNGIDVFFDDVQLAFNVVNLMFGFDEFKAVVKIFSFKDMIFNIRKRIERKIYPFLIPFTKSCLTLTNQMKALNSFNFIVDR